MELVCRKVASVSGDVRRVINICNRAVEMASPSKGQQVQTGIVHVAAAVSEMFSSPMVTAIRLIYFICFMFVFEILFLFF